MQTNNSTSFKNTMFMAGAGAIGGAVYAFRHPSEKVCKKLEQTGLKSTDVFQSYKDCFSCEKAVEALVKRKINQEEYDAVSKIIEALNLAVGKENFVRTVSRTPYAERKTSFKDAVKDADKARAQFRKTLIKNFNKSLQEKLIDAKVFDKEKFDNTLKSLAEKSKELYKELGKYTLKGAAKGAVVGVALSGLFWAFNKMTSQTAQK